jgi:ribosomal protein L19
VTSGIALKVDEKSVNNTFLLRFVSNITAMKKFLSWSETIPDIKYLLEGTVIFKIR